MESVHHSSSMENYLSDLPEGTSLALFCNDRLIFSSKGKWLHPLFEAEDWLRKHDSICGELTLHDSISGLAAAFLTVRMNVRKVNVDMISSLAIPLYEKYGVKVTYKKEVDRIKCITETLIRPEMSLDEAYVALRKKASLTSGISLKVEGLCFSYGHKPVIDNLSFYLERGDALILEGENGSGKTTLLRLILGLEKPSSGIILYDDRPDRPRIGYIRQFAERNDFPFTVKEVVMLTLDSSVRDREGECELALRRCGAWDLRDRMFFSLSGGEMAKVNLARALASQSRLIVMDEPSASLDADSRNAFCEIMHSLSVTEMPTILIVNHDSWLSQALNWPRRRLEGGHLV